jgi:hypothetical protein
MLVQAQREAFAIDNLRGIILAEVQADRSLLAAT